jgi:hypothetical protein
MHGLQQRYTLAIGGCLVVLMACSLTGAGVRQRWIAPPEFDLRISGYRVVSYITQRPTCPPYNQQPAAVASCVTMARFSTRKMYTVWLMAETQPGPRGQLHRTMRRLLRLPLE